MCGILGLIGHTGSELTVDASRFARMRDLMTMRGPDDSGIANQAHVRFGSRRLAVIDLENGQQPVWSPDQRFLLAYNGELYNDAEIRSVLRNLGFEFRTNCDTETVLHAFATWGVDALKKFRGMYAIAVYDFKLNILTLARDPLGIKPLYFARIGNEFIFSSHIPSILDHPAASLLPNLNVISSYLSTIRVTLGNETLFSNVYTLRPGQLLQVQVSDDDFAMTLATHWPDYSNYDDPQSDTSENNFNQSMYEDFDEAMKLVRECVTNSVHQHLRSDVPVCLLLSGGLDSSIIGLICRELGVVNQLQTWCAADADDKGGDLEHGRIMAEFLHTNHHEVHVTRDMFLENWQHLIQTNGLPLSTPNETAIYAVAKDIKPQATVALSGEGADEFFGGYSAPMLSGMDGVLADKAMNMLAANNTGNEYHGDLYQQITRFQDLLTAKYGSAKLGNQVEHYLRCNSWISVNGAKRSVLQPEIFQAIDNDSSLKTELDYQFGFDPPYLDPMERLLRVHQRINLSGLLSRLDTSTAAASIEGRTPFADVQIANLASRIPFKHKLRIECEEDDILSNADYGNNWHTSTAIVESGCFTTKKLLRRAFGNSLPQAIVDRPKASFPLPFQEWLTDATDVLHSSSIIQQLILPEVIDIAANQTQNYWQVAWPILNLAMWCRKWWG